MRFLNRNGDQETQQNEEAASDDFSGSQFFAAGFIEGAGSEPISFASLAQQVHQEALRNSTQTSFRNSLRGGQTETGSVGHPDHFEHASTVSGGSFGHSPHVRESGSVHGGSIRGGNNGVVIGGMANLAHSHSFGDNFENTSESGSRAGSASFRGRHEIQSTDSGEPIVLPAPPKPAEPKALSIPTQPDPKRLDEDAEKEEDNGDEKNTSTNHAGTANPLMTITENEASAEPATVESSVPRVGSTNLLTSSSKRFATNLRSFLRTVPSGRALPHEDTVANLPEDGEEEEEEEEGTPANNEDIPSAKEAPSVPSERPGLSRPQSSANLGSPLATASPAATASLLADSRAMSFSIHNRGLDSTHGSISSVASRQPKSNLLANRLASRTTAVKQRLNATPAAVSTTQANAAAGVRGFSTIAAGVPSDEHKGNPSRRYKPGDHVLVCNLQSRWSTLVNRHGFPEGEGATPEEMRGPYIYVLAVVKQVHFEELKPFYTVTRTDTGADQRGDADFMEPIRTQRGQQAAYRAAMQNSLDPHGQEDNQFMIQEVQNIDKPRTRILRWCQNFCFVLLLPVLWVYDYCYLACALFVVPGLSKLKVFMRYHAKLFLNGEQPYSCKIRLTMVNFIVICSAWYMFIDQARLAFIPPNADRAIAIINFIVFLILVLELLFEVFIRPDGYRQLIASEKAFTPWTVRFINAFHLVVESVALCVFIPEFVCLFSKFGCSDLRPFSLHHAALMAVVGPSRRETFFGRAYFALVRLRVFGLVRHWKTMWVVSTFLDSKRRGGLFANVFPLLTQGNGNAGSSEKHKDGGGEKHDRYDTAEKSRLAKSNKGKGGARSAKNRWKKALAKSEELLNKHKDATLTNASNIGTALMVTNSYRAMALLWVITGVFPLLAIALNTFFINDSACRMTRQLQEINVIANDDSPTTCEFFNQSVHSWVMAVTEVDMDKTRGRPRLTNLTVEPARCFGTFANNDTGIDGNRSTSFELSKYFFAMDIGTEEKVELRKVRAGSLVECKARRNAEFDFTTSGDGKTDMIQFSVSAMFDHSASIELVALSSLLLQIFLLIIALVGLSTLRRDSEILVLGPLRKMLKIVARYAKNPLMQPKLPKNRSSRRKNSRDDDSTSSESSEGESAAPSGGDVWRNENFALGNYETEQLIAAVTKITDLLRKCWGVAGADIISTNLATREGALTEVFNPTVPGKSVYALFAFAVINDFDHALRNLGGDVMVLINDVAAVLHGEVFRWGFGDSGQCNKNLGAAFLMVFRIGLVKEVVRKLEEATDVIFSQTKAAKAGAVATSRRRKPPSAAAIRSTQRRESSASHSSGTGVSSSGSLGGVGGASAGSVAGGRDLGVARGSSSKVGTGHRKGNRHGREKTSVNAMSLSLAQLPGISTFTDRAVIGMLKSLSGIYRDKKLLEWNNDFRLGAGVKAFSVSMIYGMDAGWAVEGAVGSEYKIDATYLSPHVNMASRMTTACKQYGVSIMLSQAVEELMSDIGRTKLRHLDTITVKGSSVKQKIYTYDARPKGVDFFLLARPDDQADLDADRYTPNIWNNDPDLKAMRQHVTPEFIDAFEEGRKLYIHGDWPRAIKLLERANDIMVETAIEEGYLEDEFEEIQYRADAQEAAEELKRENGDGPSQCLLSFMRSHGGRAPDDWEGWHPLTRK